MQILQTIPANTVALEGAVWNGSQFLSTRGDGQPIHPFTTVRTKQGTGLWPQFAPPRIGNTAKAKGARRSINTGDAELWLECEVAGTTAASAPVINYSQIGTTVVDGTVTWRVKGLHAFKGFSNWPARTNLLLQSNTFNVTWSRTNSTATPGAGIGPDGVSGSAWLVTANTNNATHLVVQPSQAHSANATVVGSVFVKAAGYGTCAVRLENASSSKLYQVNLTFSTGAVTTTSFGSPTSPFHTVSMLSNGWYRVAVGLTNDLGETTTNLVVYPNTSAAFIGDAVTGILVYGAQLEAASFASPYIATTTATATRAATNLTIPTAGVIRVNDFGVDMWVIPGATGLGAGGVVRAIVTTSNPGVTEFFEVVEYNNNTLILRRRLPASSTVEVLRTHAYAGGVPIRIQAYQSRVGGIGIRINPLGTGWTAWSTNTAETADNTIAAALGIGSRNSASHFAGNYPATRFILHSDPKAELERLAAIDDAWVAGQI